MACFHCNEPIPPDCSLVARVGGVARPVCCIGCRAAAEWIEGLGLGDYYSLRSEPAVRGESDRPDFGAWDRPQLARLHVRRRGDGRAEAVVLVEGLRCAACAWLIEHALGRLPGVHEVGVNAPARRVRLLFDPERTRLSTLLEAMARLGYVPQPLDAEALDSLRQRETRDALKRLVVAGLGAMQAMMYAVALYAGAFDGIDPAVRDFFRWVGFVVATPVVLYSARPFFAGALREWRSRRLSMDTPVAIAIGLIYVASLVETLRGGHEIYFDSVTMFVFFLLTGRYVEMRARHRAGDVVDALARLQPTLAERRGADGYEQVGVHELEPGDVVRVAAGASVPADGVLVGPACRVDESLLSGESTPRRHAPGDALIAGSLVLDGPVEVRVQRVGAETVLSGIVQMVTRAATRKPRLARMADVRATHFVIRVLTLTVLTALGWTLVRPEQAFAAALAVLVVSCPCAFALAVPSALTRALAVLARRGVLVMDADALEALAGADCVVFDKTGTLSLPHVDPAAVEVLRGSRREALALAAALEQGNTHPLAAAVRAAAGDAPLPEAVDLAQVAGAGVEGSIDGRRLRLGRADFAGGDGGDALLLADADGPIARFPVGERPRPGTADLIARLQAEGMRVEILSGDAPARVAAMAATLGIRDWQAAATPADKLARVAALREGGARVVVVGDGINDAPVLAAADVAVALGSGTALAQAVSGLLLTGERLDGVLEARQLGRRMLAVLRQNLNWALGYNLSVVPLAAFGFVPPWLAALGMSASSVVVIMNSLRIDLPAAPAGEAGATREALA
ncbi:heavy metal translocating P-type ATPase [Coralloluteibacterium thermophilus]|uniref:Heavy metal translocating P-type ATPase n=1 Tax=Coralloluteibacterium thermophilum TaxID=2707049 RepID=A0ABV9NMD5_9GAMM